ncbi:MAG: hypothetical protein GY727_05875, partial [Gammaproteobacteria bacterium]|nr:hypothetical protein [Gammaproteobacteria bacterium]
RYATADTAAAAGCVNCHNNHADSPKHNFKLNDVMGVLIVNIPIGTVSDETVAFFAATNDGDFGKDTFGKTKEVFETTLAALTNGGQAPTDLEMRHFTTLPPTTNAAILHKLDEVKSLWDTTVKNLAKLVQVEPNSAEYIVAYNKAYKSNNATMKGMNEVVSIYTAEADKQMAMLFWIQCVSAALVCLVIGLGWIFFARPLINFLTELVAKLSDGSKQVSDASTQISASSQTLAEGCSEQASSLEETYASREEMASVTKQNADNAEEAAKLVDVCSSAADNGSKAVNDMTNSMEEINKSSKEISEITKVIDGIA